MARVANTASTPSDRLAVPRGSMFVGGGGGGGGGDITGDGASGARDATTPVVETPPVAR